MTRASPGEGSRKIGVELRIATSGDGVIGTDVDSPRLHREGPILERLTIDSNAAPEIARATRTSHRPGDLSANDAFDLSSIQPGTGEVPGSMAKDHLDGRCNCRCGFPSGHQRPYDLDAASDGCLDAPYGREGQPGVGFSLLPSFIESLTKLPIVFWT